MENNSLPSAPHKDFESIKRKDEIGVEYWAARDLMLLLGYVKWGNFEEVIQKAKIACKNSGQAIENHFADIGKMVQIGSGAARELDDYKLDRYACYLIAQNGDPSKSEIALAQTYFAVQTRNQEIATRLSDAEKRLFVRNEVTNQNKKLFKTAKGAGVSQFGLFNDAGYRGLYDMPLSDVEKRKGVKKGELLDRAGSTELAANLFRITQTDEKIGKGGVYGDVDARRVHTMVGEKVRQTIKDIGGTLPEHLPAEKHIKDVKKELKLLEKQEKKKLGDV